MQLAPRKKGAATKCYQWRATVGMTIGRIIATVRILLLLFAALSAMRPSAVHARWLEARSANFVVFSDGNESGLRETAERLEDYDQLLRTITGTSAPPSPAPLKIYLVDSVGKLRQVTSVPDEALGIHLSRVGGTAIIAVRGDRPGLAGEEVLLHEYAHHFMARYYPAAYPAWYREGFAEYVMTARFLSDRIEIGRFNPGRAIMLLRGAWLPAAKIFSRERGKLSPVQLSQFYAESWLIVHYLFADPQRREALTRYLADLHRDVAEPDAFWNAFGKDHKAFDTDLKHYRDGKIGYGVIGRKQDRSFKIDIRALPEAADELLLRQLALNLGIPEPEREAENLTAIRAAAGRYPGDAYARRVLARAEIGIGDRATGVRMLDELIGEPPSDRELFYYRGLADFFAGRSDSAKRAEFFATAHGWFQKAVAADPNDYSALYRYAITAPEADQPLLDQLQAAHALAPLVGDIAVDTATALAARRRYAEAEAVILPIASNPHAGNIHRAQALIESIRKEAASRHSSR